MTDARNRFDLYSRTISNSAVAEFDAEPDPAKRFFKYACSMTSSEQAALEALIKESESSADEPEAEQTVMVGLDSEIVDHFKKAGGDWRRHINDALRASINRS